MARRPQLYLDNNATAPLRPEAIDAMTAAMGPPANPSSIHGYGRAARMIVEEARAEIAMLAGSRPADLVFTSGGTEANNLALSAFDTVITSAVEHDSVMQAAPDARRIPVDHQGCVDPDALRRMLTEIDEASRPRTLVSVMMANNETGVIQPMDAIVEIAREAGVAVHSDMVQMLGKRHLDFAGSGLDFATLSAHKIGGPTGVGALLVRPGRAMTSLLRGGGQEQNRRAGTENLPGIAGFGAALAACDNAAAASQTIWRDKAEKEIITACPQIEVMGGNAPRLANTSALYLPGLPAQKAVVMLDLAGFCVSAGAACSSGKVNQSPVAVAMGHSPEVAQGSVRVSLGWATTLQDVETATDRLASVVAKFA